MKHMKLFKCQTINQFRIGQWLTEQGIEPDDISFAEFPDRDKEKITNPAGQYMIVKWVNDHAEIDTTPE